MLALSLIISVASFAQQLTVQGVPRQGLKSNPGIALMADVNCDVDFSQISRWIGEGTKQAAMVVKWNDDKEERLYVWGYRWSDDADGTGEAMLRNIAAGDPNFYILIYGETQYGAAIGGIGYDLDGDGFALTKNGETIQPDANGLFTTSSYDFDDYSAADSDDLWFSGWYNGYLSYWVSDGSGMPFTYSNVGATSRILTDQCVDGWCAVRDMSDMNMGEMTGELYYLPAIVEETTDVDYTKGTFIINEDWYGHQNSTVNFLTDDGEWIYRVVQRENPGVELGCTAQYGTIYGDRFYIMSKQDKDPGATVTGARLTVCDAKTMKVLKQIQTIATDESGRSNADGRGFLGVDEHKGYVGTSNGIYILDLDKLEITGSVTGTGSDAESGYASLYGGQTGNMVRVNDRVFAVHQQNGLLVINPETDRVEQTIAAPEGWGFGSVVLSKDGNLWLSLASRSGSGAADTRIVKLDPVTLEQTIIDCPEDIYGPANSWYAWTPDCFSASTQTNTLYWNGGNSSWFSGYTIYKYDIDNNEFSTYLDFTNDPDGFYIYGCSFRVDPVTDDAFVSLYKGFGDPTYTLRRYDSEGEQLGDYPMIENYWFPSLPVFPDNEAPVVTGLGNIYIDGDDAVTVTLRDKVSDADNMAAAIVNSVESVSDETVVKAEMQGGDLVITPLGNGDAVIKLKTNSNGKLVYTDVNVNVTSATGISEIEADGATEVERFTLDGKRLDAPQRGINIVRMSDGTVRKVVVK